MKKDSSYLGKMEKLHILNGDALAFQLKEAGWDETYMVWREALCQGPVQYAQHEPRGLDERMGYFEQLYGSEAKDSYREFRHIISWLIDYDYLRQFEEIVCWFGADYFCQINFIALLSIWHQEHQDLPPVSLVSTDFHPEVGHITCLGNLSPKQLLGIYPDRREINDKTRQVADILWKLFTSEDPLPFNSFPNPIPHDELNWSKIIRLHKELFPSTGNGLDVLEERILKELGDTEKPLKKVIGSLLRQDQYYGLGDSQYVQRVEQLLPVLIQVSGEGWERQLRLTPYGGEILSGQKKVDRNQLRASHIGGASGILYAWDKGQQVLVRKKG